MKWESRIRFLHDERINDTADGLNPGANLEEAHMRNRQLNAMWAYEKGKKDNVVEFVKKDGKTYVKINDYNKLRELFGQLLREIQRIKSQGDYTGRKKSD